MTMIAAAHLQPGDVVFSGGRRFTVQRKERRGRRSLRDILTFVEFNYSDYADLLPPSDPRDFADTGNFQPTSRYRSWDNALLLEVTNR